MSGIFNKIMSIDMCDDGPDQNNLHKSRFEGDNFRKRYMSKCQGESTAVSINRLERIEIVARDLSRQLKSEYLSAETCYLMLLLSEELKR